MLIVTAVITTLCLYIGFSWYKRRVQGVSFRWNEPEAADDQWKGEKMSELTYNLEPGYITGYAPATGEKLGSFRALEKEEITERIHKCSKAQKKWSQTSMHERKIVMKSLLDWIVRDMDGIARVACRDTGKTLVDASFGEILTTCEKLRWIIAKGENYLKTDTRGTNLLMAHKVSRVHYEPLGVVAAIVSWNYPFHNIMGPIIASLFTGNGIVVKPSEYVVWSTQSYVDGVRECLSACGHDPDIVQVVPCYPQDAVALTKSDIVQQLTFIGSERVGRLVGMAASEAMTPVVMELGGKDACVILESANIKKFAPTWMRGAFQAAGQNCIGIERFIVADKIYDQVIDVLSEKVRNLHVGDYRAKQVDVGAMVSEVLLDRIEVLIKEAVEQGARLIVGGKRYADTHQLESIPGSSLDQRSFFEPTLIADVTPEMRIAQEELFAPVMTIMRSKSVDDAISIANGTRYGLGASLFGQDKKQCNYVASKLEAGMVAVNDFGAFYLNQELPFGGVKSSGYGRFAGQEGLRGLCHPKVVMVDRLPNIIETTIPSVLAYPIKDARRAFHFVQGLVEMTYGNVTTVIKGITKMI